MSTAISSIARALEFRVPLSNYLQYQAVAATYNITYIYEVVIK